MLVIRLISTASVLLLVGGIAASAQSAPVSFATQVFPILEKRCVVCHQGQTAQKGLRINSVADLLRGGESGPAIDPSQPDSSLLIRQISGTKPPMPPVGDALTASEVETIRLWIADGAQDDLSEQADRSGKTWWSLQPLQELDLPEIENVWSRSLIDGFLLARMQEKNLSPSREADRRTLIRRLKYDLHGLPPSREEVKKFASDSDPKAYERLVDQMLAAPAYGERWGRHWLDVVRFGESNGYEQNHLRPNAWPYRDWVINSFNADKPFNHMILEQIAGDQIAPDNPSIHAATGFLVAGPHDTVGIANRAGEAQKRANHLNDMIMGTASAFLGLTVHCARCHDHKFDPISNVDYYRLQAAFAGVWHGERTWADPVEITSYNQKTEPLKSAIQKYEADLEELRTAKQPQVEQQRKQILAQHRPSVDAQETEETFPSITARFVRLTINRTTSSGSIVDLDEFEIWSAGQNSNNVALTGTATASSTRVDEANPDTYSANYLVDGKFDKRWISEQRLPSWIKVELPQAELISQVKWSSDRLEGFGGRFSKALPEEYQIEVSLDGKLWKTVATSENRLPYAEEKRELLLLHFVLTDEEELSWNELESSKKKAEQELSDIHKPQKAFLGSFKQPEEPSFVMQRGDPMSKGTEVSPGSLSTLEKLLSGFELAADAPESERRLQLARWIASDDNALAARVIVNRVWMYHFGQPFVLTPSDFGINGGEPSHPALLDWLANRFVNVYNWRFKPLHREIVLSAAYRQNSEYREDAASVDRDAAYLWRFPPRRLSAEEIRDSILSVSHNLNRQMGGPGFRLYRYTVDNVATYYPIETFLPDTYRRSVYHQHARSVKPELLGQFDCPDTSLPAPKRITTTSPLQALSLLNNKFVIDQAGAFASQLEMNAPTSIREQVVSAWHITFSREPAEEELTASMQLIQDQGLPSFCRALLNTNEFLHVF